MTNNRSPRGAAARAAAIAAVSFVLASGAIGQKAPSSAAQTVDFTQPLTLEKAIGIALSNQPQVAIARSQLRSARSRVTEAMSSYYPQIAPQYQYTSQKSTFAFQGSSVTQTSEQAVSSIGLRQNVFDMGKREASVAASKYSAESTSYSLLDTRQAIIYTVVSDWYEILRRKALVLVQRSSVDRAKTTLDATRAFADAGTSPKKDVLQAEADYGNALVLLSQAENDVRIGQSNLKNSMGIVTPLAIVTPDDPLAPPSTAPDVRKSEDYAAQAMANRPDLKRDAAAIDAGRHNVKSAQIDAGLTVDASLTEGYRFDPDPGESRTFITTFSYPLFDAGLTKARVSEARESLFQTRQQRELTRQSILLEVETAFLSREEARMRISSTQAAVKAARENYAAATEAQKEGAGTIIDVITAQTLLVTAETNAVQAVYDFYAGDARLARAIGSNDTYLAGGKKP